MSALATDIWLCDGVQWKRTKDGVTSALPSAGFSPKTLKSKGLVCVNPSQLLDVDQYGVDQLVAKVAWSAIETSEGVYDWSAVDALLAPPYDFARMTLRIQAGVSAPAYLKNRTGVVTVNNPPSGLSGDVGHYWEDAYLLAWHNLMAAAGARYNSHPRVVLVSADLCMTIFSEPWIIGDNPSGAALYAAGCTQSALTSAMLQSVQSTCQAFPNTRVEYTIHSAWQIPTASGLNRSWPLGRDLASELCETWGRQLLLSDYGLSDTDTWAAHTPTGTIDTETDSYAWMYLRTQETASIGGDVGFQATLRGSPTHDQGIAFLQNVLAFHGIYAEHSGYVFINPDCATWDTALKNLAGATP